MGLDDELLSLVDQYERKREKRPSYSAGQGIFCPALSVIALVVIIIILTFVWRSCVS